MAGKLVAGIETGGTKILARICDREGGGTVAEGKWATRSADDAVGELTDFLNQSRNQLEAIGIAAFGPLIVDPGSDDYGLMQATTKPGWTGANLRKRLGEEFGVPVAVDTDVGAAAIAEQAIGAGGGLPSVAYVTVGTGIGAGLAIRGQSLKGALHPEAGHLAIIRSTEDDIPSVCRFHGNCAEGLASGPAVRRRLVEGKDLSDDPFVAELEADYLGQLAAALVLAWSPHRIVWGGGVIAGSKLVPLIEQRLRTNLNFYGVGSAADRPGFCVPAALKNAGLEGALMMARQAVENALR